MLMEEFYVKAVEKVKTSMHGYWIDKNINSVLSACRDSQVYLIGVTNPNWEGNFILQSENYNVIPIDEDRCIISGRMALKKSEEEIIVDASVSCEQRHGGINFFYVHMTKINNDLSLMKDAFRDVNQISDGKYRDVIHQVYDVVLEYSCLNNTFKYRHNEYRELFGMDKYYISIDQWFWSFVSECVHKDDELKLDVFRDADITKRIKMRQDMIETEFRIRNDKKPYIWVKMYIILVPDENRTKVKEMYILFKNIDEQKSLELENQILARKDDVTSVWNKSYSETLIMRELNALKEKADNKYSAIAMLDIDDLTRINDTYGKMTGDFILSKIADTILREKDSQDIIGRFYADCFVIYMSSRDSEESIEEYIHRLHNKTSFDYVENNIKSVIKCSISYMIVDGKKNMKDIFRECENGLAQARKSGKGIWVCEK